MSSYRLIIDLATDRVIWFTKDSDDALHTDQHSALAEYKGELPEGMNQKNSFNYVFRDQQFRNTTPAKTPPVSLLEQNRKTIGELVKSKVDEKRVEKLTLKVGERAIQELLAAEAARVQEGQPPGVWLSDLQAQKGLSSIDATAAYVLNKREEASQWLFKTELLLRQLSRRVSEAATSDELFKVRDDLFSSLKAL